MTLQSNLFKNSVELAACEVRDSAHVVLGAFGPHVSLIQIALQEIDGAEINGGEIDSCRYGPSTASAVLAYKKKRDIINRAYQQTADNIVGKMTIARLDRDMLSLQYVPAPSANKRCALNTPPVPRPAPRR